MSFKLFKMVYHVLFFVILFMFCLDAFADIDGSGDENTFSLEREELLPHLETRKFNADINKKKESMKTQRKLNKKINYVNKNWINNSANSISGSCRNSNCSQLCRYSNAVPYCSCHVGYILAVDNKSCVDIDECIQYNGGCQQLCINTPGSFYCSCLEQYRLRKDNNITCEAFCSPPCLNNGECIGPNHCSCPPGYFGAQCSSPICNPPCANGGTCKRWNSCKCSDKFSGPTCLNAVCEPGCLNGGHCTAPSVCQCPTGYFGKSCQNALCNPPCRNGGTCIQINKCHCHKEFIGSRCQAAVTKKCNLPCENGGQCIGRNRCMCPPSYEGVSCKQRKLNACQPPCQNGGQCSSDNKCMCINGTIGNRCQHRKCPIVMFTTTTTRLVRAIVTETFLGQCDRFAWKKCEQQRYVQKLVPREVVRVGYKTQCS